MVGSGHQFKFWPLLDYKIIPRQIDLWLTQDDPCVTFHPILALNALP